MWGPGLGPIDVAAAADDSDHPAPAVLLASRAWRVTASRRSAGLPGGTPLAPADQRGVQMSLYPTAEQAAEHAERQLERQARRGRASSPRTQQANAGQMMLPEADPRQQRPAASAPEADAGPGDVYRPALTSRADRRQLTRLVGLLPRRWCTPCGGDLLAAGQRWCAAGRVS